LEPNRSLAYSVIQISRFALASLRFASLRSASPRSTRFARTLVSFVVNRLSLRSVVLGASPKKSPFPASRAKKRSLCVASLCFVPRFQSAVAFRFRSSLHTLRALFGSLSPPPLSFLIRYAFASPESRWGGCYFRTIGGARWLHSVTRFKVSFQSSFYFLATTPRGTRHRPLCGFATVATLCRRTSSDVPAPVPLYAFSPRPASDAP